LKYPPATNSRQPRSRRSSAFSWHGPLNQLKGVGSRLDERLTQLGIRVPEDLLFHLPLRYEDRTCLTRIGALRLFNHAVVEGVIELTQVKPVGRRSLLCRITDGSGALTLRFFHFHPGQQKRLARGAAVRCFGEVRPGQTTLEMVHPELQILDGATPAPLEKTLTPVYPTTQGIHQIGIRKLVKQALERLIQQPLPELLPDSVIAPLNLPPLNDAIRLIHAPAADINVDALTDGRDPAVTRIAFEELLGHRLGLLRRREHLGEERAPRFKAQAELYGRLIAALPFSLTNSQQRVLAEIGADLQSGRPMLRLLQGDVGSGKTVVAALAGTLALESGYKVAFMAPTEILAEQHFRVLYRWYRDVDIEIVWLSGSSTRKQRAHVLERLCSDDPLVVVGTHALFQDQVKFERLGLVIVDEQHRFGVHQRLALRQKGRSVDGSPHQLIMTATPIPRTLAMTAYADLDTSIIDELPPGRSPVRTVVVPDNRRDEVMTRIASACAQGRQVYWVCSLIEESEALQAEAASATAELLTEKLAGFSVGLIHGRLAADEKEAVMRRFAAQEIDLLVATTVIEVGVDIANASLMIIENAERFGLAQLHQLRGRVGRGAAQSDCVLLYRPGLSELARARLHTMRETNDGFRIAEKDLELRGPGELLGTRQAGAVAFRIADLSRDRELLPAVANAAEVILHKYPEMADKLIERWLPDAQSVASV
jgi:ATP-dependent DNA helicase RecG